jgi:hypothetical protein
MPPHAPAFPKLSQRAQVQPLFPFNQPYAQLLIKGVLGLIHPVNCDGRHRQREGTSTSIGDPDCKNWHRRLKDIKAGASKGRFANIHHGLSGMVGGVLEEAVSKPIIVCFVPSYDAVGAAPQEMTFAKDGRNDDA